MDTALSHHLAAEWKAMLEQFAPPVRAAAAALAREHAHKLATWFYEQMLEDQIAGQFLTHEQVKAALHASLKEWVVDILDADPDADLNPMVAQQLHVGDVHARVNVPVHVVLRGARALKEKYHLLLTTPSSTAAVSDVDVIDVLQFIVLSIDFAMEIAAAAYATAHDRSARAEESYRLFSMAQDVTAEKAQQRSALLDWENRSIYEFALGSGTTRPSRLGASDFGLWFKHKGAHIFHGTYEVDVILSAIEAIDTTILPAMQPFSPTSATQAVRDLHDQVRVIITHLDKLFDQRNELEAGRDALTRLLSRRFLDVILAKEVNYARRTGTTFALVGVDIDHFKDVNDTYGHDSGDLVLQQIAIILGEHTRGGDYVFRLGGEEFLLLLVDTRPEGARRVADQLRQRVAREVFRVRDNHAIRITISVGLAMHDNHPDHQRILRRVDDALYRAKNSGRNSVVVDQSPEHERG